MRDVYRFGVSVLSLIFLTTAQSSSSQEDPFQYLEGKWAPTVGGGTQIGAPVLFQRAFAGWDAWFDWWGRATISRSSEYASHIRIDGSHGEECYYYVIILSNSKMAWNLKHKDAGECPESVVFERPEPTSNPSQLTELDAQSLIGLWTGSYDDSDTKTVEIGELKKDCVLRSYSVVTLILSKFDTENRSIAGQEFLKENRELYIQQDLYQADTSQHIGICLSKLESNIRKYTLASDIYIAKEPTIGDYKVQNIEINCVDHSADDSDDRMCFFPDHDGMMKVCWKQTASCQGFNASVSYRTLTVLPNGQIDYKLGEKHIRLTKGS